MGFLRGLFEPVRIVVEIDDEPIFPDGVIGGELGDISDCLSDEESILDDLTNPRRVPPEREFGDIQLTTEVLIFDDEDGGGFRFRERVPLLALDIDDLQPQPIAQSLNRRGDPDPVRE